MSNHGGARSRSGPKPSMYSARSDARDLKATRLPVEGYSDDFPPLSEFLPDATEREGLVWAEAWTTPQAAQWIREPYRFRTIAMWVRWTVKMEDPEAPAAVASAALRLADQIGLTPSGLKENGWVIVPKDQIVPESPPAKQRAAGKVIERTTGTGRRLRGVVRSDGSD
ncbi:hypothetical protein ASG84_26590 [Rhodococcus sp. Leaf278]|uniref:hypothetical protein n=1 Tax=Rhodococcus sp. Leaf278 TaxID=1736319 RepID=UPI000710E529|nr:hypothetical protein [Rhodococcus sp. Leaf278]KQU48083.1 hypothetical protein ASG84_26590 [Rhodococcus sp. Leaf278]